MLALREQCQENVPLGRDTLLAGAKDGSPRRVEIGRARAYLKTVINEQSVIAYAEEGAVDKRMVAGKQRVKAISEIDVVEPYHANGALQQWVVLQPA